MHNVYLVITDLHASYKNKTSRYDYVSEIDYVIDNLLRVIDSYKDSNVYLIFLGDTVDNSYKDLNKAIFFNNLFVYLNNFVEEIYFVIGNHEMTYYKDNPFWSLFNNIESESLKMVMNKSWQPTGLLNLGRVIDRLEDGEVLFSFNHHPTPILDAVPGKYNIGLFHKDIASKAIIEDMKTSNDLEIFDTKPTYVEGTSILKDYDYCFLGHAHKLYGRWIYTDDNTGKETTLAYLGSLGRPNHTEVNDKFLERDIPAVIINNGKLHAIEHNTFNLLDRAKTVKEDVIAKQQMIYENKKNLNLFKDYKKQFDDPVENIRATLSVSPQALFLFNEYLNKETPIFEQELLQELEEIRCL